MVRFWRSLSRSEKILILLFVLTLPFLYARVRGDGIGYYAYLRSPLIDHNLSFASDWNDAPNTLLRVCGACSENVRKYWDHPANQLLSVYLDGHIYENPITKTGHLPNFYTVGPAILWFPFVAVAHLVVLGIDLFGMQIPPDGHSWPYIWALSIATALYGFLGLFFSFRLAKSYVEERWAFWATVGIWFASSLPVYMYLDPSWSHAHSAFCVSLFLWYWNRTLPARTPRQWLVLGLLSGLMIDVFPGNILFVLAPALECLPHSMEFLKRVWSEPTRLRDGAAYAGGSLLALLPTFVARQIVFGSPFSLGAYGSVHWNWGTPAFRGVLFSANRGLFVWTPILIVAFVGLFALLRIAPLIGRVCLLIAILFYLLISFYPWWHGAFSFGNRFFVSLTPIFVLGLAAAFSWLAQFWDSSKIAARRVAPLTVLFILWNLGLIYQWSTQMLPNRGPVYWDQVLYSQFREVPQAVTRDVFSKFRPRP